ncbi:right-handed parallel beta-helix repeat-containing protein [bacterium]|nr:right-handed parallel beta-helix repeat-containing protein [bacterium]
MKTAYFTRLVLLLFLLIPITLTARIINVPDDQETIQAGIDATMDGDTVLVEPGRYVENINFNGRSIVLGSLYLTEGDEDFIEQTIIDGDANGGSVIVVRFGESPVITGFTVTNGETDYGGGFYIRDSSPTLSHLIVTGNIVERNGAGIYCTSFSSPTIDHVLITDNSCGYVGGGFGCYGNSTPTITNCVITGNYSDHVGGGIHGHGSELTIRNVTITGNTALHTGGAIYLTWSAEGSLENCILWENEPHEIQLAFGDDPVVLAVSHCDIDGGLEEIENWDGQINWGVGNLDINPEFADVMNRDFSLAEDSPCIDGGNPEREFDPDGTRADIGALYFHNENGQHVLNVPDAYQTIQVAINNADEGDIVLVQPGEYVENIDFNGRDLILGSRYLSTGDQGFIEETIINGNGNGSVVTFANGESEDAVLTGFTVTNGSSESGAGIYIRSANPSIRGVTISGNNAEHRGGGIYIDNSSPAIENSLITNNFARDNGGGISIGNDSNPTIIRTVISRNSTDGNGGGIVCDSRCSPEIDFCTITENFADDFGGGIWVENNSHPVILNSILWGDEPQEIYFWANREPNLITINYSDVQGGSEEIETNNNGEVNWGEGNIDANPLFADPDNNDFHLTENSPCIDAGDPQSPRDPDNTPPDMGVFYFYQEVPRENIIIRVPFDYETIQEAIDVSIDGDTVLVSPGRYVENLDFRGINVLVASIFLFTRDTEYINSTIIDGNGEGSVATFDSRETSRAGLMGFTILNGSSQEGGGIYCYNSGPVISYCSIHSNRAETGGGALFSYNSNPQIRNCTISDNSVEEGGGGIFGWSGSEPWLVNCILWDNSPNQICFGGDRDWNSIIVASCDVQDGEEGIVTNWNAGVNWWDDSIDEDPLFADAENHNYHLTEDSPCIDVGRGNAPDDPDGSEPDMGAFYFNHNQNDWLRFDIPLRAGWNMISSPVQPRQADMWIVWVDLINRGNLLVVKDHMGRFMIPHLNFSDLEDWDVHYGYHAKVLEEDVLTIDNLPVDWEEPIELAEGWTIVSYFPEEEILVRYALADILNVLLIAKDGCGRFYSPEHDFSNMQPLRRGQGYKVNLSEPAELIWALPEEATFLETRQMIESVPKHFIPPARTCYNMSLLLTEAVSNGANVEIGAFNSNDFCVGAAVLNGDAPYGMAVWGDDPETEEVEGLNEGETIHFRLWNGIRETTLSPDNNESNPSYRTDGFMALEFAAVDNLPMEFGLSPAYPNPFNPVTTISYQLPEPSLVSIRIYDIQGREIMTLVNGKIEAGYYNVVWNAVAFPSGLYICRIEAGEYRYSIKLALIQ